ncbi:HNH endonuclease [Candidatus Bathyarchaeota archaeon]|jgi:hypothetical protein|nr:HNH endonuclease [Candidatus Bathyarchaeota archaeon]
MGITKEQLETLYVNQGLSVRECAEILGLPSHGGIQWAMKKHGIKARPAKFQKGNQVNKGRKPETCSNWKGGKQAVLCDACGKELFKFPSLIKETNFCNIQCRSRWRADNFKGESNPNHGNSVLKGDNNPNWKGGIAHEPYAPIWIDKRFKAGIRERDGHTCQNPDCRGTCERLTIHHIDYDKKNCEPVNLITLCISCNARANFNRDFWQAGYQEIIRQKYENEAQTINL